MATRSRRRAAAPQRFSSGPWKGTRTTEDPNDDPPFLLLDATNLYIPDPTGGSGAYQRPGFSLRNDGEPVVTAGTSFRGQGVFAHTALDGTITNFVVVDGKILRSDADVDVFTDVSPVGITISDAIGVRVYGTSFADQLIVTDGVNRPWLAANLTATPITGTYIDYDGAGTAWSAFGPAVIYAGSIFFILSSVGGISARTDITWSSPGVAAEGYQQADFDFRWTLEQTASDPLYALAGTNTQLYYWRRASIGSISGVPGPDLQGQATHDAISRNVGTLSPQCVTQFGNILSFVDASGRPYRFQQGSSEPEPLWLQMRGIVDDSSTAFALVNKLVAVASFEPTMNVVVVAPWSASPSQTAPATEGYLFDAQTGIYFGRLRIAQGCQMDAMGLLIDSTGRSVLTILGSAVAPDGSGLANSGYVWTLNALTGTGSLITTESAVFITKEDGTLIATEGTIADWSDGGEVPIVSATTGRLGYDLDTVIFVDRVAALVGNTSPCTVSAQTAAVVETVEGTPTPSTVQDGVSKIVAGFSGIQGRGVTCTFSPTTADTQWNIQSVIATAIVSHANPDEA